MGSKFRYFGLWQASKRRSWRWAQPVVIIIITGNQPLPNDSLAPFKKYSHTHWCRSDGGRVCVSNECSSIPWAKSWFSKKPYRPHYFVANSIQGVSQWLKSETTSTLIQFSVWSWQIALTFPNSVQFICPLSFPLTDWTYYRCAASSFQSWCQANWWLTPKWSCQCYKIWKRKGIRDSTPPTWFRTLMCLWP